MSSDTDSSPNPYNEGYEAYHAGVDQMDNPYSKAIGFIGRAEWWKGWAAAYRSDYTLHMEHLDDGNEY